MQHQRISTISVNTVIFLLASIVTGACAAALVYPSRPCPFGWARYAPTDECYRVWPSNSWNASVKVRITFDEATAFCASQQAVLPVLQNASHMRWVLKLMGLKSGTAAWLGIRDNPTNRKAPQDWRTKSGHQFTEYFEWDTKQSMPGPEPCAALQAAGDISNRIPGGNNKMITVDCYERLSVICARQRIPVGISGANLTSSGTVTSIWRDPLTLKIYGQRIPPGTLVSLQTTNDKFSNGPPNQPTHCKNVKPLVGDSIAVPLNVSSRTIRHAVCNGTCMIATATWPASTPFVRGAYYSLCFFVPIPFARFNSLQEFGFDWMPNVAVEFIQRRSEYLQDVCTRHQQDVNLFLGSKKNDRGRSIVRPYYFSSDVSPV